MEDDDTADAPEPLEPLALAVIEKADAWTDAHQRYAVASSGLVLPPDASKLFDALIDAETDLRRVVARYRRRAAKRIEQKQVLAPAMVA